MKHRIALGLSALVIAAATSLAPAYAKAEKASASKSDTTVTSIAMVPVKGVAFVTAAVIGTPIAVTRMVYTQSIDATKTVAHGSNNWVYLGAASLIGIPVGVAVGTVEGLYYGPADSYYHSSEHPFGLAHSAWLTAWVLTNNRAAT